MTQKTQKQLRTTKLTPKQLSELPSGWADGCETKSKDDLEEDLIKCQQDIKSTEEDMSEDDDLQDAKDQVKAKEAKYKDNIRVQKLKTKYLLEIMKQRGYF